MSTSDLLAALQRAMEFERDGHQFYRMAARQSNAPNATTMFEHLADEERRHYEALQRKYRALLDTGTWSSEAAWGEVWSPEKADPIFSDDFLARIQGQHLEAAALSIGILLEKQAIAFYTAQAEAADAEPVRAFFQELATWEEGHYRMLLREDEDLRDDYWQANRFEPLD